MALRIIFAVLIASALVMSFRFWSLGRESQEMSPAAIGLKEGRLQACPPTPNCVSTNAPPTDTGHFVETINYPDDAKTAQARILKYLQDTQGFEVREQTEDYLYARHRSSTFGFVDDLEIHFPAREPGVAHVRSASRVGHSDLGANRKRVERLRDVLNPGN